MAGELQLFRTGSGAVRVLLIHGSGSGARPFLRLGEQIVAALPGSEAVSVGLAGYGSSPTEAALPVVEQHQAVIAEAMGNGVWHLVGHSMGGYLALKIARQYPEQVASLSLIEPTALGVLDPERDADATAADRAVIEAFSAAGASEGIRHFIEAWNQSAWENLPEGLRAQLGAMAAQIHAEAVAVSEDHTGLDTYAALRAPLLLACGTQSPLPARRIVERLSGLPAVRAVEWVAEAQHMDVLRQPERFAPAIARHIEAAV